MLRGVGGRRLFSNQVPTYASVFINRPDLTLQISPRAPKFDVTNDLTRLKYTGSIAFAATGNNTTHRERLSALLNITQVGEVLSAYERSAEFEAEFKAFGTNPRTKFAWKPQDNGVEVTLANANGATISSVSLTAPEVEYAVRLLRKSMLGLSGWEHALKPRLDHA